MRNEAFYICAQAGVVPLAVGQPGTSKTASCRAFAHGLKRKFIGVRPSSHMPEDLGGYPHLKDGRFVISPPFFVADALEAQAEGIGCVVLMDECTTLEPSKQAPMLRFMEEGIPNSIVVAACNSTEQAANGFDLEPPLVNRMCVLQWENDLAGFCEGVLNGWPDPNPPILPEGWEGGISAVMAQMTSFLRHRPTLFQDCPKERSSAGKPWPSQRSWTNAGRAVAAARSVEAGKDVEFQLVGGCVSVPVATEFFTWLDELDLPDPESLLKKPSSYQTPDRIDKVWAVATGVAAAVMGKLTKERWLAGCEVLGYIAKKHADIAVPSAETLARGKGVDLQAWTPSVSREFIKTLFPMLKRAGFGS